MPDPTPLTCLVVDDEAPLRQVLVHLMRSEGFQMLPGRKRTRSPQGARRAKRRSRHLDLNMREMDGIELLRESGRGIPTPQS